MPFGKVRKSVFIKAKLCLQVKIFKKQQTARKKLPVCCFLNTKVHSLIVTLVQG